MWAANGDANGNGDFFDDGDEIEIPIESVVYDPSANRITLRAAGVLFDDIFRVELDGDDATSDGTGGLRDLAGNLLAGGDYRIDLDLPALRAVDDLLGDVGSLGLSKSAQAAISAQISAVRGLIENNGGSSKARVAILEAFVGSIRRLQDRGEVSIPDGERLIEDVERIILDLSLLS